MTIEERIELTEQDRKFKHTTIDDHKYKKYQIPNRSSFHPGDIITCGGVCYTVKEVSERNRLRVSSFIERFHEKNLYPKDCKHSLISPEMLKLDFLGNCLDKGHFIQNISTKEFYYNATPSTGCKHRSSIVLYEGFTGKRIGVISQTLSTDYKRVTTLLQIKELRKKHKDYKEECIKNKKEITSIVTRIFPTSRVDLDANIKFRDITVKENHYSAVIHFPEFEITNSRGESHIIKDLYFRVSFNELGLVKGLWGSRSTVSYAEYISEYRHSHLSNSACQSWGDFCLGGTDLSMLVSEMGASFDPNMWEAFLHRLPDYLNWESLQGGPYRKMAYIQMPSNSRSSTRFITDGHVKTLSRYMSSLPLKVIQLGHNELLAVDNKQPEVIEKVVTDAFIRKFGSYNDHKRYFILKNKLTGEVVNEDTTNDNLQLYQDKLEIINKNYLEMPIMVDEKGDPICIKIEDLITEKTEKHNKIETIPVLPPKSIEIAVTFINDTLISYLKFQTIKQNHEQKKEQKQKQPQTAIKST